LFLKDLTLCVQTDVSLQSNALMNAAQAHAKAVQAGNALRHENETHTGLMGLAVSLKDAAVMSLGAQRNGRHQPCNAGAENSDLHELYLGLQSSQTQIANRVIS
jgi:hypothetical protein